VNRTALIIGNSDGIGRAVTGELLKRGWSVAGISRSESTVTDKNYRHIVAEVQQPGFAETLNGVLNRDETPDLCIYCAGIGELLDTANMENEAEIIEVNLLGMVKVASSVIPLMVQRGQGHFIGLSSLADELLSGEAPSYHASKAGFSNYLESLSLALKPHGVHVTNIRFGFVDTKMAKSDVRPCMMGVERAARHVLFCIDTRPIRYTAPKCVIPLITLRRWMLRAQTWFPLQ